MGSLEPAFLPAGGSCNGVVVPKGSIMANATTLMEKWQENYHYVFTELRDPRVDDWLFMSSPWPVLALCAVYYYIVRFAGPAFMKDRPPYDIQKLMIAYNFFRQTYTKKSKTGSAKKTDVNGNGVAVKTD